MSDFALFSLFFLDDTTGIIGKSEDCGNTFKTVLTVDHVRCSAVIRDLLFCKTELELCDISGIIIYDGLKLGLGPKCKGL